MAEGGCSESCVNFLWRRTAATLASAAVGLRSRNRRSAAETRGERTRATEQDSAGRQVRKQRPGETRNRTVGSRGRKRPYVVCETTAFSEVRITVKKGSRIRVAEPLHTLACFTGTGNLQETVKFPRCKELLSAKIAEQQICTTPSIHRI